MIDAHDYRPVAGNFGVERLQVAPGATAWAVVETVNEDGGRIALHGLGAWDTPEQAEEQARKAAQEHA